MGLIKQISALKKAQVRFELLLILVLFTLPFGWQAITNSLLMVVLLNSGLSLKRSDWAKAFFSPLFFLPAILILFYALSLMWSSHLDDGMAQVETKLSFVLGPLIIIAGGRFYEQGLKPKLLKTFLLGNVAVSVSALFYATYRVVNTNSWYQVIPESPDSRPYYFTYEVLAEPFMHPGYLSTYLGFAIFIALYFVIKSKGKQRIFNVLIVGFLFVMMVLLQGRINILAMLAVLGLGALVLAFKQKAYGWLAVPLAPVFLLLLFMLFGSDQLKDRYFQVPDFSYDISGTEFNSATFRLAEWTCAADVIGENKLIGTGVGDNRIELLNAYEKRGFWVGLERKFNAHNQYLETAIATGFVGLFLLLLLFLGYGRIAIQNQDYLSLACLVFFAFSMLTESMLERAWAVLLFASYFPLMLLLETKRSE